MGDEKAADKKIGIKGWLLFFVILFIIAGIFQLVSIPQLFLKPAAVQVQISIGAALTGVDVSGIDFSGPSSLLFYFQVALILVVVALLLVALVFIFQKKKKAVKWTIIFLWASFGMGIINSIIEFSWMAPLYSQFTELVTGQSLAGIKGLAYGGFIVSSILSAIITGLVTWYFLKSKRVQNTLVN